MHIIKSYTLRAASRILGYKDIRRQKSPGFMPNNEFFDKIKAWEDNQEIADLGSSERIVFKNKVSQVHNIGSISAANSRLLILAQRLNSTTCSQNLAQYRPYTKSIVTFTMVSSSIFSDAGPVWPYTKSIGTFTMASRSIFADAGPVLGCI